MMLLLMLLLLALLYFSYVVFSGLPPSVLDCVCVLSCSIVDVMVARPLSYQAELL